MTRSTTQIIKQNIERYISESNTTRSSLANSIGISRSSLYDKMDGNRPWLLDEIMVLADVMGCEEKYIWTDHAEATS